MILKLLRNPMFCLLASFSAIVLTVLSLLEICSTTCEAGHQYLLFNHSFENFGLLFFTTIFFTQLIALALPLFQNIVSLLIATGIGAELKFIMIQKYQIGSWCPICLGIFSCVMFAGLPGFLSFVKEFKLYPKEPMMITLQKILSTISATLVGFIVATIGVTHFNPAEAKENELSQEIAFGNLQSPIKVYVFTDWICPSCRKLEPSFKGIVQRIDKDASITFIDHMVHPESLNFTPYNLSFMIYNKNQYFELRQMLTNISTMNTSPSEEEVENEARKFGITYKELPFSEVASGVQLFKLMSKKLNVSGTPSVVIVNEETKKGKMLKGVSQINTPAIVQAIQNLQ